LSLWTPYDTADPVNLAFLLFFIELRSCCAIVLFNGGPGQPVRNSLLRSSPFQSPDSPIKRFILLSLLGRRFHHHAPPSQDLTPRFNPCPVTLFAPLLYLFTKYKDLTRLFTPSPEFRPHHTASSTLPSPATPGFIWYLLLSSPPRPLSPARRQAGKPLPYCPLPRQTPHPTIELATPRRVPLPCERSFLFACLPYSASIGARCSRITAILLLVASLLCAWSYRRRSQLRTVSCLLRVTLPGFFGCSMWRPLCTRPSLPPCPVHPCSSFFVFSPRLPFGSLLVPDAKTSFFKIPAFPQAAFRSRLSFSWVAR